MMAKAKKIEAVEPVKKEWWEKGIQFECQGSGRCCVSHGEYGFVYMTKFDRQRMAKVLKLSTADFTDKYCTQTDGVYHLKDAEGPECLFLKDKKCSVYEGRPDQCRTWPFWPEVMNSKSWKKDVAAFCPGVGKGRTYTAEEIRATIELQTKSEDDLVNGR